MPPLPIDEWTNALDRMNTTIDQMRHDLDHHRAEWSVVMESPAVASPPDLLLAWLERRLAQWDSRLKTATELAAEVEHQLEERAAATGRWSELFERWTKLIEQGSGAATSEHSLQQDDSCPAVSR